MMPLVYIFLYMFIYIYRIYIVYVSLRGCILYIQLKEVQDFAGKAKIQILQLELAEIFCIRRFPTVVFPKWIFSFFYGHLKNIF